MHNRIQQAIARKCSHSADNGRDNDSRRQSGQQQTGGPGSSSAEHRPRQPIGLRFSTGRMQQQAAQHAAGNAADQRIPGTRGKALQAFAEPEPTGAVGLENTADQAGKAASRGTNPQQRSENQRGKYQRSTSTSVFVAAPPAMLLPPEFQTDRSR